MRSHQSTGIGAWLVAAILASGAGLAGSQELRWYDAYTQGVDAAEAGDWQRAEQLLRQAKESNATQGRRVYFYGDVYQEYVPDLYLAQVFVSTGRLNEAVDALASASSVLGASDARLSAIEQRLGELKTQAAAPIAQDPVTEAPPATTEGPPTPAPTLPRVNPGGPTTLPGGTPQYQGNLGTAPTRPNTTVRTQPSNQTFSDGKFIVPASPRLRTGVLAYFDGDYARAVDLLEPATREAAAASEAFTFLALAQVGLVLTGQEEEALLQDARDSFRRGGDSLALIASIRPFISPRVLDRLGVP